MNHPPIPNPECKSFLILWHATETWEWVENHEEGPHDYAWTHELYGKSAYSFIPCEKPPVAFKETPEDTLLNKLFPQLIKAILITYDKEKVVSKKMVDIHANHDFSNGPYQDTVPFSVGSNQTIIPADKKRVATYEAWVARTKEEVGPSVFKEALQREGDPVEIIYSTEIGDPVWAVTQYGEFWMDAFPTKEEATQFVTDIGWPLKNAPETCVICGEEMAFNVPRLGAAGGFVHKKTRHPACNQGAVNK